MSTTFDSTMTYLRRLCSGREYCARDIMQKALKRLEDEDEAAKAVELLISEGFLSNERYAAAFARDKSSIAGWGPIKIVHALSAKGIDRQTIANALETIDADKADGKLMKTLSAKYKLLRDDPMVKIKLLKFALSRGYNYDAASKAVSEILHVGTKD